MDDITHSARRLRSDPLLPVYDRLPVEFVRGAGVTMFDAEGNGYLDMASGTGVNALGHGDAGVLHVHLDAVASGLVHVSNLYHSAPARRLAAALVQRSCASSVFLCNSGTEANEGAFKFARRWARATGSALKTEIVAIRGGSHGRLFASLAATDRPAARAPFRPLAGNVSIHGQDLRELAAALDPETVAALIVEPVQSAGGVRVLDEGFLRGVRRLTRERGVALIFDEVQCGLGRTGWLFAHQRFGIEPDMVTLAGPLGGGLPVGAVLLGDEIAAAIQPGDHASTFGGGPLAAAVAAHVVERVADPALLESVRANGAWLGDALQAIALRTERLRGVRGVGYLWGMDVLEPATQILQRALAGGLLLSTAGSYTLRLLPPLTATRDDLGRAVEILEQVL